MLIPFFVVLQLHAVVPTWKTLDRATVAWRAGARPYELLLEESVVPRDADPIHRIRIRVPGRPDFIVVDERGPGAYVPVREALKFSDPALVSTARLPSARVLVLPVRGTSGTTVFAVFGWPYASDPYELTLVGFDRTGYPRVLFRHDFDLTSVVDLDGDGIPELVGRLTISERYGKCSATYDPYAVYHLTGDTARYDPRLSQRYNDDHYVWAGAEASERIEIDVCMPRKYRIVRRKQ